MAPAFFSVWSLLSNSISCNYCCSSLEVLIYTFQKQVKIVINSESGRPQEYFFSHHHHHHHTADNFQHFLKCFQIQSITNWTNKRIHLYILLYCKYIHRLWIKWFEIVNVVLWQVNRIHPCLNLNFFLYLLVTFFNLFLHQW